MKKKLRFFINFIMYLCISILMIKTIPFRGNPPLTWLEIFKWLPIIIIGPSIMSIFYPIIKNYKNGN